MAAYLLAVLSAYPLAATLAADGFDVQDVSVLWPVAQTRADADRLIPATEMIADGGVLWPAAAFEAVLEQAERTEVMNSAGRTNKISFGRFRDQLMKPACWKVVSFRVDPSAPGTSPMFTRAFGEIPQLRLVFQPVTTGDDGVPKVHDVTAHLVFNFVERFEPPAKPGGVPIAVPDRAAFGKLVEDLERIKHRLAGKGIVTAGPLGVHPGLRKDAEACTADLLALLRQHVQGDRLAAVAFMGIETPEPWIFFSMRKADGAFQLQTFSTLGGESAQMLTFKGGTHVMPTPVTANADSSRGVSTATLFEAGVGDRLKQAVSPELPEVAFRDVPNLIANPERSHFLNTDCVSCHSESSRRVELGLSEYAGTFRYRRPEGISGGDPALLPKDKWNVRNFGWFPKGDGPASPTVTARTANEAAESAHFINKQYLHN